MDKTIRTLGGAKSPRPYHRRHGYHHTLLAWRTGRATGRDDRQCLFSTLFFRRRSGGNRGVF